MAFVASTPSTGSYLRRPTSVGPFLMQTGTYAAASADTSGTITVAGMHTVLGVMIDGVVQTAAATFSGNVITLAFVDPAATIYGDWIAWGV